MKVDPDAPGDFCYFDPDDFEIADAILDREGDARKRLHPDPERPEDGNTD